MSRRTSRARRTSCTRSAAGGRGDPDPVDAGEADDPSGPSGPDRADRPGDDAGRSGRDAVRVALVGGDEAQREGRALLLDREEGLDVVARMSVSDAAVDDCLWHQVDVVVVDVWDPSASEFDRYRGVTAARRIRAAGPVREGGPGGPVVVAVSRHMSNVGLNKRLAEVGVDARLDPDSDLVRDPARLAALLRQPGAALRSAAGPVFEMSDAAKALGLSEDSCIDNLVSAAASASPAELFVGRRGYDCNAERMRWTRAVRRAATTFGLSQLPGRPVGGPHLRRGLSIDDFRGLLDIFRGVHPAAFDPCLIGGELHWWHSANSA